MLVLTVVILIVSVIIHEVAHGYAAYALGDQTALRAGRLTLNPLRHIDLFGSILIPAFLVLTHAGIMFGWAKPVPYNPYNLRNQRYGEAIVAAAGVATNLFIAVVFALFARFGYAHGYKTFADLAGLITLVNLSLGLFNLIPIPPIDGYTVIRGIAPHSIAMGMRKFEEKLRAGSIFTLLIVLFIFSYFLSTPFYALIQYLFHALVGA